MAWTIWAYAPLRLGTARLCADTARIVFSLSVGSGALMFVTRNISLLAPNASVVLFYSTTYELPVGYNNTVGPERSRCPGELFKPKGLRAPRRKHHHCWHQTHPLRGSIVHITILLLLTLMTTETRWCADTACWQGLHSHSPLVLALACWLPNVSPSAPYRRA